MAFLSSRSAALATLNIISETDLKKMGLLFQKALLKNLQRLIEQPDKLKKHTSALAMSLGSTLDALEAQKVSHSKLDFLIQDRLSLIPAISQENSRLGNQLETLIMRVQSECQHTDDVELLGGDLSTRSGREAILKKALLTSEGLQNEEKLSLGIKLLDSAFAEPPKLDSLLAARKILETCEDSKDVVIVKRGLQINLSAAYTYLAVRLPAVSDFREFCFISETMEVVLRTKVGSNYILA